MIISVVLPAYKEEENLKNIIPRLKKCLNNIEHEILVVDTMDPLDNTREICDSLNVRYISRECGNFYGDAIRTGFKYAKGKYLVIMDADGSHSPEDILVFYDYMRHNECDLVIGSRYCDGGYTDNNFILKFMSWVLNKTYSVVFSLNIKDVSDSFRMYKTEQVKKLELECSNFDIVEEILIKLNLSKENYIIKEIPISFNKREAGESKRNLLKFICSYLTTMNKLLSIQRKAKNKC